MNVVITSCDFAIKHQNCKLLDTQGAFSVSEAVENQPFPLQPLLGVKPLPLPVFQTVSGSG